MLRSLLFPLVAALCACGPSGRRVPSGADSGSDGAPADMQADGALDQTVGDGALDLGPRDLGADVPSMDTGTPDEGLADTGIADRGTPDRGAPDMGTPDTGAPDMGLTCDGAECSFFPACGCPTSACYVADTGMRECASAGSLPAGSVCTTFNACAPGLACVRIHDDVRQCTPVCEGDGSCPGATSCSRPAGAGTQACTLDCDLRTQDGCAPSAYCLPLNRGGRIITECRGPAGTRGRGDSCDDSSDCERGFTCARDSAGAPLRCRQWCRDGRDSDCRGFDDCVSADPPLNVGGQRFGICVP